MSRRQRPVPLTGIGLLLLLFSLHLVDWFPRVALGLLVMGAGVWIVGALQNQPLSD